MAKANVSKGNLFITYPKARLIVKGIKKFGENSADICKPLILIVGETMLKVRVIGIQQYSQ
jgi:hypothetical protein